MAALSGLRTKRCQETKQPPRLCRPQTRTTYKLGKTPKKVSQLLPFTTNRGISLLTEYEFVSDREDAIMPEVGSGLHDLRQGAWIISRQSKRNEAIPTHISS